MDYHLSFNQHVFKYIRNKHLENTLELTEIIKKTLKIAEKEINYFHFYNAYVNVTICIYNFLHLFLLIIKSIFMSICLDKHHCARL